MSILKKGSRLIQRIFSYRALGCMLKDLRRIAGILIFFGTMLLLFYSTLFTCSKLLGIIIILLVLGLMGMSHD